MRYNKAMRKEKTLFIIGLWVMVLPFLGFPNFWRKLFFIITGFFIMYIAYLLYLEVKIRLSKGASHSKSFVDNIGIGQ
jgi:hypothetical protein